MPSFPTLQEIHLYQAFLKLDKHILLHTWDLMFSCGENVDYGLVSGYQHYGGTYMTSIYRVEDVSEVSL